MLRMLVEVANASAVAAKTRNKATATSSVARRSTVAAVLNRPVGVVPDTSTCGALRFTGAPLQDATYPPGLRCTCEPKTVLDDSLARRLARSSVRSCLVTDPLAGRQQVAVVDRLAGEVGRHPATEEDDRPVGDRLHFLFVAR